MSIYLYVDMVAVVSISIYIPDSIVYYIMSIYLYIDDTPLSSKSILNILKHLEPSSSFFLCKLNFFNVCASCVKMKEKENSEENEEGRRFWRLIR